MAGAQAGERLPLLDAEIEHLFTSSVISAETPPG
jgi:hypothetical protein